MAHMQMINVDTIKLFHFKKILDGLLHSWRMVFVHGVRKRVEKHRKNFLAEAVLLLGYKGNTDSLFFQLCGKGFIGLLKRETYQMDLGKFGKLFEDIDRPDFSSGVSGKGESRGEKQDIHLAST